jgi:hypothetical protein
MADPNALYSTVVQSSAAIVAIVGGFITATVLNLATTRRNLDDSLVEQERELHLAQRERTQAWIVRERLRAHYRIWNDIERIIDPERPLPNATQVARLLDAEDIDQNAFAAAWQALLDDVRRVEQQLENAMRKHGVHPWFFDEWVKAHDIEFARRDQWLAGKRFHYVQQVVRPLEPAEPKPPSTSRASDFPYGAFRPQLDSVFEADSRAAERQEIADQNAELDRYEARIEDADQRVTRIEAKIELLQERRREVSQPPPHVGLGLAMLALLAAFGMGYPLSLMPQSEGAFRPEDKAWVILAFVLGVASMFLYVLVLLYFDRHKRSLPAAGSPSQRTMDAD